MAGKVTKNVIYTPWRILQLCPDLRTLQWWYRRTRADNRDDSILLSLISEFERDGMTFASALDFCPELLVKEGILTRRRTDTGGTEGHRVRLDARQGDGPARRRPVGRRQGARDARRRGDRRDRSLHRARRPVLPRGRLVARQGRQAPAGHAIRRTDDRRHNDRKPPQSRGQRSWPSRPARPSFWTSPKSSPWPTVTGSASWRCRAVLALRPG